MRSRRLSAYLLALLVFLSLFHASADMPMETPEPDPSEVQQVEGTTGSNEVSTPGILTVGEIEGAASILVSASTGSILFGKSPDERLYPASTTKIMTLLLALEYGHLEDTVTVPDEAADIPKDSSKVPISPGEELKFEELLYGLMLPSGNDAANAVAVIVGGSVENFVNMMNAKAAELGCTGTHFVNPHGYHDENHYTTARDLAKIACEGLKDLNFRTIVSSPYHSIPPTAKQPLRELESHNFMLLGSSQFYYAPMIGIKTGFHSSAGQCFVGAAVKDGITLVSVTLKTSNDGRWNDTKKMMEYGFAQYEEYSFDELYALSPFEVEVKNTDPSVAGSGTLKLDVVTDGSMSQFKAKILPEELEMQWGKIRDALEVTYAKNTFVAPIKKGAVIGKVSLLIGGGTTLEANLVAARAVAQDPATIPKPTDPPRVSVAAIGKINWTAVLWVVLGVIIVGYGAYWIYEEKQKKRRRMLKRKRMLEKKRRMEQQRRNFPQ